MMEVALQEKSAKGAFDILKTLVILLLPTVHVMEQAFYRDQLMVDLSPVLMTLSTPITALTVFGPSIFMICLGIGMANGSNYKSMQKMGVQILMINFMLNIVRFLIPNTSAQIAVYGHPVWTRVFADLFESDIYYFVGLFYILYAKLRKHQWSLKKITVLSCVLLVINCTISELWQVENELLGALTGNFVSGTLNAYFPLCGWCIFPCIGMIFEKYVLSRPSASRKKIFIAIAAASIAVFAGLSAILSASGSGAVEALGEFGAYSCYGFVHFGLILAVSMVAISVTYFIYFAIPKNSFETFMTSLSALLFPFYLLQWLLVAFSTNYYFAIMRVVTGELLPFTVVDYIVQVVLITGITAFITYKKGFTISRWLLKVTNYSRWFKKKKSARGVS